MAVAHQIVFPPIVKYDQTCASKDHEMWRGPSPDGYVTVADQIVSPPIAKYDQTYTLKDHEMRRGPSPDGYICDRCWSDTLSSDCNRLPDAARSFSRCQI